jgi:hypothetical protein
MITKEQIDEIIKIDQRCLKCNKICTRGSLYCRKCYKDGFIKNEFSIQSKLIAMYNQGKIEGRQKAQDEILDIIKELRLPHAGFVILKIQEELRNPENSVLGASKTSGLLSRKVKQ